MRGGRAEESGGAWAQVGALGAGEPLFGASSLTGCFERVVVVRQKGLERGFLWRSFFHPALRGVQAGMLITEHNVQVSGL